ncbi:MAG: alpha/beta hydrolase [Pararhodobacter sp.]|nr:alpha/beta hydrolase [Pararhodobacter sp.]
MSAGLTASPLTLFLALAAVVALLTGCAVALDARATARENEWEAANPPVGRMITLDGRQVHLRELGRPAGTAPDLVLIHGANGNLRDFTFDLTARLAADYRIIALDRPGLGWSDSWGEDEGDPRVQARILRRVVAEMGVQRPIVLGHSYGGAVAMAWALEDPEGTAALVLLAGATWPWEGGLGLWYRINDGPLGNTARHMLTALAPESAARRSFEAVFAPHPVPEGYVAHFGAGLSMRRASQAANTRQVNALNDYLAQMQPGYGALTLPIEMVHGDADTIVGIAIHSERLAQAVASAHLTRIEGGGHMPHHSHPDIVVAAIERARQRAGLR